MKPNPKGNLLDMEWNSTGTMFSVRFSETTKKPPRLSNSNIDTAPCLCWIYDSPSPRDAFVPKLRSLLINEHSILHGRWNTIRPASFVFTTGLGAIHLWGNEWEGDSGGIEETAECIGVPNGKWFRRLNI
jgi:hypothetical protein